jgi:hypothetical protein
VPLLLLNTRSLTLTTSRHHQPDVNANINFSFLQHMKRLESLTLTTSANHPPDFIVICGGLGHMPTTLRKLCIGAHTSILRSLLYYCGHWQDKDIQPNQTILDKNNNNPTSFLAVTELEIQLPLDIYYDFKRDQFIHAVHKAFPRVVDWRLNIDVLQFNGSPPLTAHHHHPSSVFETYFRAILKHYGDLRSLVIKTDDFDVGSPRSLYHFSILDKFRRLQMQRSSLSVLSPLLLSHLSEFRQCGLSYINGFDFLHIVKFMPNLQSLTFTLGEFDFSSFLPSASASDSASSSSSPPLLLLSSLSSLCINFRTVMSAPIDIVLPIILQSCPRVVNLTLSWDYYPLVLTITQNKNQQQRERRQRRREQQSRRDGESGSGSETELEDKEEEEEEEEQEEEAKRRRKKQKRSEPQTFSLQPLVVLTSTLKRLRLYGRAVESARSLPPLDNLDDFAWWPFPLQQSYFPSVETVN